MAEFRDPIHGFIFISEDEEKIVNSAPFQRLRNIRQLATTYLVYHGAEHTRFGHSLGVMHLATRAFDFVVAKTQILFRDNVSVNNAVIKWYRQILRLIALTHDLGHAPFSHASEDLFSSGFKHEQYTEKIIKETKIADFIYDIGTKLHAELANELNISFEDLINKHNIRPITAQLIWMIYGEKPSVQNDEYIWPDFLFLKSFMDGELDCDKMDYLLRDSLFCGVTYGKYDLDRFISTLTVHEKKDENIMELAIDSGGIQAFEEFVLARYFMFIQVYFHKTRRYLDNLLIKALKEVLTDGVFPVEINEYLKWDDIRVIQGMREINGQDSYSYQYLQRELKTCVFESHAHATGADKIQVRELASSLKSEFGEADIEFDEVDKKAHNLVPTVYSQESDIKVLGKHTGEAKSVMEYSLILKGIVDKIYICRLYARGGAELIDSIRNEIKSKYFA